MPLTGDTRDKILLMEEAINFPAPFLSHTCRDLVWKNVPMVPYSSLAGATLSLAHKGSKVAIVTGFYIPGGNPPATETDGPPGALVLAEGLKALGMEVFLVTDQYTLSTLKAGLQVLCLSEQAVPIVSFPMEHPDQNHLSRMSNEENDSPASLAFARDLLRGPMGRGLSHLVFIERVGPNHTLHSLTCQKRTVPPPRGEFESALATSARNRCFNSGLEDITRFTAKTHFLLEGRTEAGRTMASIGIGDRGNEIGAGRIPWEVFNHALTARREAVFCCRVATDYFISSGISNWGGYALLAGVALIKGRLDVLEKVSPEQEMTVLEHLIRHGPAIDGITGKQHPSVDGIEFDDYMNVIERVKEIALR
jgi:D-glutamate cyclase